MVSAAVFQFREIRNTLTRVNDDSLRDAGFRFFCSVLAFVIILLLGYIGYQLFFLPAQDAVPLTAVKTGEKIKRENGWDVHAPEIPFEQYIREIESRDFFALPEVDLPDPLQEQKKTEAEIQAFLRNFRVVGIVVSARSQVILEDLKTHQTTFFAEGDTVAGAKVKEIKEGGVIFLYHDKDIELKQ